MFTFCMLLFKLSLPERKQQRKHLYISGHLLLKPCSPQQMVESVKQIWQQKHFLYFSIFDFHSNGIYFMYRVICELPKWACLWVQICHTVMDSQQHVSDEHLKPKTVQTRRWAAAEQWAAMLQTNNSTPFNELISKDSTLFISLFWPRKWFCFFLP